ncbi:hypothetical protein AB205_0050890 [Aquarana catesbeiana]|uniref:Uncharacterized protein n=1 Tax=Aquarana catesbeiana TaxID=8400 RepID=A0A2G9RX05_AQUCT|nr:hypothetical protein AB205_0050890 [Aquarana catesbeiana]
MTFPTILLLSEGFCLPKHNCLQKMILERKPVDFLKKYIGNSTQTFRLKYSFAFDNKMVIVMLSQLISEKKD